MIKRHLICATRSAIRYSFNIPLTTEFNVPSLMRALTLIRVILDA